MKIKKFILIIIILSIVVLLRADSNQEYTYKTYIVQPGDTSWNIADKHNYGNKDIRELIYFIGKDNGINPGYIYPGQEIEIRIYESRS